MAKETIRKRILSYGKWIDPRNTGKVLEFTKDFASRIVDNFKRTPFAPVIKGHHDVNEVDSNPDLIITKNIQNVETSDDGLYATFEIDSELKDKYNDVSVGLDTEYIDKKTGENVGPALRHIALTTDPYIKDLGGFSDSQPEQYLINLSDIQPMEEETKVDTNEVEVTQDNQEQVEESTETEVVADTEAEEVKTQEGDAGNDDEVAEPTDQEQVRASDLEKKITAANEEIQKLQKQIREKDTNERVTTLMNDGKILPSMKTAATNLYLAAGDGGTINLSDGTKSDLKSQLDAFFSNMPSLVNLEEKGVNLADYQSDVSPTVLSELREAHPEMDDVKFREWVDKNKSTINKMARELDIK